MIVTILLFSLLASFLKKWGLMFLAGYGVLGILYAVPACWLAKGRWKLSWSKALLYALVAGLAPSVVTAWLGLKYEREYRQMLADKLDLAQEEVTENRDKND